MEFERYKRLVEKYYQNDCRELNFQNRVIIPFLESFLPKSFDVVDSSFLFGQRCKEINELIPCYD